jgi:UDP-2-acetamido-3-amino-2,3-dideoxy-glucuronate N-acetyltransferase
MTDSPDIRVAVIGAGYWGKNLVRNFSALGVLGAICDVDPARVAALVAAHPEARNATADGVLDDPGINAVAIATPAATHGALARRALDAGKHVFVEKPLCLDLEEASDLGSIARRRGLVLMVGHMLLYHPAYVSLRETVFSGGIGTLRYVYSTRLSLGKIRREENALWSFAPHDISMILDLVGRLPERLTASGAAFLSAGVADTTLSHLDFGKGLQAHVFVSWLHPFKDHRMVVVGSEGMIVFDDVLTGPQKLRLYRHKVEWNGEIPAVSKADAEHLPYDDAEPLGVECRHFLTAISGGGQPRSDAAEGIRVLKVLDACQRSLACGQPILLGGV